MWLLSEPSDSLMMSQLILQVISLPKMRLKKRAELFQKIAGATVGLLVVVKKSCKIEDGGFAEQNLHAGTRVRTYCGNGYRQLLFM